MANFENVFADISYSLHHHNYLNRFRKEMLSDSKTMDRVLFGTDYFMTVQEKPEFDLYKDTLNFFGYKMFDIISTTNNANFLSSKYYS